MVPQVKITSDPPSYDAARCQFCQRVEFRAPLVIPGDVAARVVQSGMEMFRKAIIANGLLDYAWPADDFRVQPHADGKGGEVIYSTRASVPKPVILM